MDKVIHDCERNIPEFDFKIYSRGDGTWYIEGRIVFYCPYCGVELKTIKPTERG